jgi:hypothetical protein
MQLWIVANVKSEDGKRWEFAGVFDSEALARAACTRWNFCYWPATLNERQPDVTFIHPDVIYPLADDRPPLA